MSTQINVIVDNGGLSEKAKRQTQANRWSKLESDNRQKVEAAGTQQRDATRAQQGIGPDGRPLYGTPASQSLRRDEPAARQLAANKIDMLMVPDQGFSVAGNIPIRSKDSAYGIATSVTIQDSGSYTRADAVYSSNEGPAGNPALVVGDVAATEYGSQDYDGTMLTASNGPMYGLGSQSGNFVLQKADGSIQPVQTRLKARDCKEVTAEVLAKISRDGLGSVNSTISLTLYLDIAEVGFGKGLSFYAQLNWNDLYSAGEGYFNLTADVSMVASTVFGQISVEGDGYHFDGSGNLEPWSQNNPGLPEPLLSEWMHWAFVKSSTGIAIYFQGVSILSAQFADFPTYDPADAGAFASGTANYVTPYVSMKISANQQLGVTPPAGPFRFVPIFIHGMRVTPKALYTSNFTPPTSITSYG